MLNSGAAAINEVQVTQIDKAAEGLANNKNGIGPYDGIDEQSRTARKTQVPERYGDHAFFLPFGNNPLNNETCGERQLGGETPYDPEVQAG